MHTIIWVFSCVQLGDMSLSDNASMCLMSIIKKLAALNATEKEYREIIHRSLLEKLRKGLRSQTEVLGFAVVTYSLTFVMCLFFSTSLLRKAVRPRPFNKILDYVNTYQTFRRGNGTEQFLLM